MMRVGMVFVCLGLTACSGGNSAGGAPSSSGRATVRDLDSTELATMRRALSGVRLEDHEVAFLHESLRDSGTEYTSDGLLTFVEWGLVARVERSEPHYDLSIAGPRVNAEWELIVDRSTGEVTEGMVGTLAPEPEP